jgi:energy-coupling factor transporter ATP-binding protein EcfA2
LLTSSRAFARQGFTGKTLPYVPELDDLYKFGVRLRQGSLIMITGRSGSGKSLLAMRLALWMNLKTLYFSADTSREDASARVAAMITGDTQDEVARARDRGEGTEKYEQALEKSPITFSFRNPITWQSVEQYMAAYVELYDAYPELFVFDNLKDIEGAESEYASRDQVKNGMSEQPELTLSVGSDSESGRFNIAVIKNRSGRQDPSAQHPITLKADLARVQFSKWTGPDRVIEAPSKSSLAPLGH